MHQVGATEEAGLEPEGSGPWSFWSTIGLSLAVGLLAVLAQVVFSVGWIVVLYLREGSIEGIQMEGNFLMDSNMAGFRCCI